MPYGERKVSDTWDVQKYIPEWGKVSRRKMVILACVFIFYQANGDETCDIQAAQCCAHEHITITHCWHGDHKEVDAIKEAEMSLVMGIKPGVTWALKLSWDMKRKDRYQGLYANWQVSRLYVV